MKEHNATPIDGGRYHVVNGKTVPLPVQDTHEHAAFHDAKCDEVSAPVVEDKSHAALKSKASGKHSA